MFSILMDQLPLSTCSSDKYYHPTNIICTESLCLCQPGKKIPNYKFNTGISWIYLCNTIISSLPLMCNLYCRPYHTVDSVGETYEEEVQVSVELHGMMILQYTVTTITKLNIYSDDDQCTFLSTDDSMYYDFNSPGQTDISG